MTDAERERVKAGAKQLLAHLHDKLVLDWRRKAATMAGVRTTIVEVLDQELPDDPYPPEVFDTKVQAVFDHVITAYGDDGSSVYQGEEVVAHAGVANVAVSAGAGMSGVGVLPRRIWTRSPTRWWSGSDGCRSRVQGGRTAWTARWSGSANH